MQFPSHISALKPYVPGVAIADLAARLGMQSDTIAKLASNENPLGPSPRALAALANTAIDVSRYPDNDTTELTQALAHFHDVPPEWIVVGAGSESVIGNAVNTLLEIGRPTAFSQYSFQAFVNAAQRVGARPVAVPSPDLRVDLAGLQQALAHEPGIVYIANPGNPTGTWLDPDALRAFVRSVPEHLVVLLDEAYFEFLPSHLRVDSTALVREKPNLLVTRTFSKAYGLAGLRVGYGVAQRGLADMLRRVRPPFTVTQSSQVAAIAALADQAHLSKTLQNNEQCRRLLTEGLRSLGLRVLESHTNFVLVETGDGAGLARRLETHGLIVRPVANYGLPGWVRISVGTMEETQRLLQSLQAELNREQASPSI